MIDQPPPAVDLTLLVCTFNRNGDLREMLETAVAQNTEGAFTYEVLVVDNNSTDGTREVVESVIARGHTNVRYLFEASQGKSCALNAGLAAVRGWSYTIADDDFILPTDWLKTIVSAFRANPAVSFVSGKVLPLWQSEVPSWLGPEHWSAVALADYGNEEFFADERKQVCLLACSFRVADVEAVGGYRFGLGVSKNLIGGVEDLEILQRLWKAGRRGLYLPGLAFHHKVPPGRMTKAYHRRWHTGHGRFYARLKDPGFEGSAARLFDVPAHLYKQTGAAIVGWLKSMVRARLDESFAYETRVHFFLGFFRERRRECKRGTFAELGDFARSLISSRLHPGVARRS
jgi:glycosyltransferase involved in cell wall biosynthesis